MLKRLKRLRPFLIPYTALRNAQARFRYALGRIDSSGGATTVHRPLEDSLSYIRQVFNDFNRYAGLSLESVEGKRFAELGPGDNLGLGLLYLAWGAASYTGLDRFYPVHDAGREREIYLALRESLDTACRKRFDDAVDLSSGIRFDSSRIRCVYGASAEHCDRFLDAGSVDVLLSRVVIQSVDLDLAIPAMDRLLAQGGVMAHKIDFRDLGMFLPFGYHALEFRTPSEGLYRWMIQRGDHPNRRHIPYYSRQLTGLGYSFQILRTGVVLQTPPDFWRPIEPHVETLNSGVHYQPADATYVEAIRPRLAPEFRNLSTEDLLTAGIFLIAGKPSR